MSATKTKKKAATAKATKSVKAPKASPTKQAKSKPATGDDAKAKKLSAIDAAAKVLAGAKEPMNTKQMIEAMATKGYWKTSRGKRPDRTLYSAILREIVLKKKESRFVKTERGKFTLKKGN